MREAVILCETVSRWLGALKRERLFKAGRVWTQQPSRSSDANALVVGLDAKWFLRNHGMR